MKRAREEEEISHITSKTLHKRKDPANDLERIDSPARPPSTFLKKFECNFPGCDRAYTKPSKLEDHKRSHTGERPFCCSEPNCSKRFLRKSHLQAHAKFHLPVAERAYVCTQEGCDRRFSTAQHLKHHEELHLRPKPYQCAECQQCFAKNYQLKAHLLDAHDDNKPCSCPITGCTLSFRYPSILERHIAHVHDETKRYACVIEGCSEGFTKWTLLQAHIKSSHALKCPHCTKVYTDRTAMTEHIRIHDVPLEQRRQHRCTAEGCDKSFTRQAAMQKHYKNAHLGLREFKCSQCDEPFAHNRTLKAHIVRMHTQAPMSTHQPISSQDAKPRSQPGPIDLVGRLTGEAYVSDDRHLKCHHAGCQFMFTREYDLTRHMQSQHEQERTGCN